MAKAPKTIYILYGDGDFQGTFFSMKEAKDEGSIFDKVVITKYTKAEAK